MRSQINTGMSRSIENSRISTEKMLVKIGDYQTLEQVSRNKRTKDASEDLSIILKQRAITEHQVRRLMKKLDRINRYSRLRIWAIRTFRYRDYESIVRLQKMYDDRLRILEEIETEAALMSQYVMELVGQTKRFGFITMELLESLQSNNHLYGY